jgi:uncharacterized protein YjaG (DUF416 family)
MATQLHFDEPDLIARLTRLPSKLRVVFAALCAERQLPNYIQFSERSGLGNPNVLKQALESIWQDIQGQPLTKPQLKTMLERCEALVPTTGEEDTKEEAAYAEDAAASIVYAIGARLTDDPQEAAWAARRAFESVDYFVMSQIDSTTITGEHLRFALSQPIVQAELRRQQADLQDLQLASAEKSLWASAISKLRDRARRDAELFLNAAARH